MVKTETPDFQTLTVTSIVKLFYKNLLEYTPKQYTNALHLCWALAKRYEEKKSIEKLEKIYHDSGCGFPLGLLETIAFRDLMQGVKVTKTYNYGRGRREIPLMKIIVQLDMCKKEILDIFTDICVRQELDVNLISPFLAKEPRETSKELEL